MRLNKKYLGKSINKRICRLDEQQSNSKDMLNKVITVRHYYQPYKWNFYIQTDSKNKRIIWYPYNFTRK